LWNIINADIYLPRNLQPARKSSAVFWLRFPFPKRINRAAYFEGEQFYGRMPGRAMLSLFLPDSGWADEEEAEYFYQRYPNWSRSEKCS